MDDDPAEKAILLSLIDEGETALVKFEYKPRVQGITDIIERTGEKENRVDESAAQKKVARAEDIPASTTRRPPEPCRPQPARKTAVSLLATKLRRRRYRRTLPPRAGHAGW